MNDHAQWHLISAYIDDELSSREQESLETHLSVCSQCRSELDHLLRTRSLISSIPRRQVPPAVMDQLLMQWSPRTRFTSWNAIRSARKAMEALRLWIPVSAAASILVALAFWIGLKQPPQEKTLPIEALFAAHSRYAAETLVPESDMADSNFFEQLSLFHEDQD